MAPVRCVTEACLSKRVSFAAFWPDYLGAHRDRRTRAVHYLGTSLGVCSLAVFLVTWDWRFLLAAPVVGYGLAMPAHPLFEGNLPKTFEHPVLSFMGDFYMLYLWATRRLGAELARLPRREGRLRR
jgi:hypothetical protein